MSQLLGKEILFILATICLASLTQCSNYVCSEPCVCAQKDGQLEAKCRNDSNYDANRLESAILQLPNTTRLLFISNFTNLNFSKLVKEGIRNAVKKNLRNLHLPANGIKQLDPDGFKGFNNLIDLNLCQNGIRGVHRHAFRGLGRLINLDLGNNAIKEIAAGTFSPLGSLQELNLDDNSLTEITNDTFVNLSHLEELRMRNNQIENVAASAFAATPTLTKLAMDGNRLTVLSDAFLAPVHLKDLWLSRNRIHSVQLRNLTKLHRLRQLYIDGNKIRTIPQNALEAIIAAVNLDINLSLGNNSWACDCNVRPLVLWVTRKNFSVVSDAGTVEKFVPTCHSPSHLANHSFRDLTMDMILCDVASEPCNGNMSSAQCDKLRSHLCDAGQRGRESCVCQSTSEGPCFVCPSGSYGAHSPSPNGTAHCKMCPPFTSSEFGLAQSTTDCLCTHDFFKHVSGCETGYVALARSPRHDIEELHRGDGAPILVIVIATGGALFAFLVALFLAHKFTKRYKLRDSCQLTKPEMETMIVKHLPRAVENYYVFSENWNDLLVNLNQLEFEEILAQGAFGQVRKAVATGLPNRPGSLTVAVKSLRDEYSMEDKDALFTELQQLLYVGHHPNIINLLGFVTVEDSLLLIMEFAENGDLLSFLKSKTIRTEYAILQMPNSHRVSRSSADHLYPIGENCLDKTTLLSIAWQVSKGMSHLALMKCIHRDLAARNVLINCEMVAKVSDFGLARAVYESGYYFKETKGRLPFKWMPPEALLEGHYTTKSDVWSLGVLLWEIFTLGGNPYPGVPINSLLDMLQSGYRMAKPNNCSPEIYDVMRMCWRERANDRPGFQELSDKLDRLLQVTSEQEYMVVQNDLQYFEPTRQLISFDGYEQAIRIGAPRVSYQNTSSQLPKNMV